MTSHNSVPNVAFPTTELTLFRFTAPRGQAAFRLRLLPLRPEAEEDFFFDRDELFPAAGTAVVMVV